MNGVFELLPETSRIWIYQADRKISTEEVDEINLIAGEFVQQWAAHGKALDAAAAVLHDYFLILAVNEESHQASGCSIDTSVDFIRSLGTRYGINFLDRSKVAMIENGKVSVIDFKEIKNEIEKGNLSADTLIFNNLVGSKRDLLSNWLLPAKDTWLKKYFKKSQEKI